MNQELEKFHKTLRSKYIAATIFLWLQLILCLAALFLGIGLVIFALVSSSVLGIAAVITTILLSGLFALPLVGFIHVNRENLANGRLKYFFVADLTAIRKNLEHEIKSVAGGSDITATNYEIWERRKEKESSTVAMWVAGVILLLVAVGWISSLHWHGWISEGTINTDRCATITQLSSDTWAKYYESFTCDDFLGECLHVDLLRSSCEEFTPDW